MTTQWRLNLVAAMFIVSAAAANLPRMDAIAAGAAVETAAAPTQGALLSLETSAYQAWKSKDAKFWDSFLSDKFVGWGSSRRLDKASAKQEYAGADCAIESYTISDPQMTLLGQDAALITHKVTVKGMCGGQKYPSASWAATAYARYGNQWRAAFHAEATIIDPAVPPAKQVGKQADSEQRRMSVADPDASDALLPLERAIWDAWKDHDAKRLDGLTSANLQFINIFGTHLATKAEALKNWSGEGCDVKTVTLTDAVATLLSPTVGILTFRASADGTCFGQKVGPVWGSSIYVKHDGRWMWNFGINVPAGG